MTRKTASGYLTELEKNGFLESQKIGREKSFTNKRLYEVVNWLLKGEPYIEFAREDNRVKEMIGIIESKANSDKQFIPESIYQKCKDWDFGQKKQPSA
ncbi:MAG: hypothetical protein PHS15_05445 [Clostridiaceae bacterium]|nr:hypothetical protein [Clostridiaceae bacterium]